ncbi:prepilin-type N-terminal cleavage/methylation domain-containing protein [bacterium]|nr:MAG: prepilin-type N-terminal cleavage/methylation domain-containing protein [bacterium]
MFKQKNTNAFTLLEITLVIALFAIILTVAVPYGLRFFNVEQLNGTSRELLESLRLSQSQSMSQNLDSSFGVYIEQDRFILFKGENYIGRNVQYDQIYYLPEQININGLSEIVFAKLTGLPNQSGEIILTSGGRENIIYTNNQGLISLNLNVSIGAP